MVDAARQMLDELMGRNRNLHPSEAGNKVNWEDPEFCQFYNVQFCPHDLFINTRADLGPCSRIHDDEAKHLYEIAKPSQRKRQYEDEFLRFCNVMLHDVDRKIQKGKQRLQLMQNDQPTSVIQIQIDRHHEQLANLSARIKKLLAEAEEAGIRGDVDQAKDLMAICDELKDEKETVQKQLENVLKSTNVGQTQRTCDENPDNVEKTTPSLNLKLSIGNGNSKEIIYSDDLNHEEHEKKSNSIHDSVNVAEKQMKVCEICGAFLIVGDAQQRIEDHLMGKQHLGYSKVRNAVSEINARRQKERDEEERRRRDERSQRSNAYETRRDQRDYRERSRECKGGRSLSDKYRYQSHHGSMHTSRNSGSYRQHYRHNNHRFSRSRSRSRY